MRPAMAPVLQAKGMLPPFVSVIPKSGHRFSEKIMLQQKARAE
jgi:hypothetical protein